MIKDAEFARREIQNTQKAEFQLVFEPNPNESLSAEERASLPVPVLTQKNAAVFPKNPPDGVLYGLQLVGKIPKNHFQHLQMQRDWGVIRSAAPAQEIVLDYWPPLDTPIVVVMEDRMNPAEGILVQATSKLEEGQERSEIIFLELHREPPLDPIISCQAAVKFGKDGVVKSVAFTPVAFQTIVAWAYLSEDGILVRPPVTKDYETVELFADCEFDDATRSLISCGVVTKLGKVYYAFSQAAAHKTENEWIQEHVNSVLLDLPNGTAMTDLDRMGITFQDWFKDVIERESEMTKNVTIYVDFPTDVGYLAPLLHLGEGKRVGGMKRIAFQVEYVDSYPTAITNARQNNAAWDAVALWHHLGYYAYKAVNDALDAQARRNASKDGKRKLFEMPPVAPLSK